MLLAVRLVWQIVTHSPRQIDFDFDIFFPDMATTINLIILVIGVLSLASGDSLRDYNDVSITDIYIFNMIEAYLWQIYCTSHSPIARHHWQISFFKASGEVGAERHFELIHDNCTVHNAHIYNIYQYSPGCRNIHQLITLVDFDGQSRCQIGQIDGFSG